MLDGFADYRKHIETGGRCVGFRAPDIVSGRTPQRKDLLMVDIALGRTPVGGEAGFHFDKYQNPTFPGNQIDLAASLRRAPVAGYYDVALLP